MTNVENFAHSLKLYNTKTEACTKFTQTDYTQSHNQITIIIHNELSSIYTKLQHNYNFLERGEYHGHSTSVIRSTI